MRLGDRITTVFGASDPGFANLGLGSFADDTREVVLAKTIVTKPGPLFPRMQIIHGGLRDFCCDVFAVEEQESTIGAKAKQRKTSVNATKARLGEGAVLYWAADVGVEVVQVTPTELRAGVGLPASATKKQVWEMVRRILRRVPGGLDEHAKDALGLAYVGSRKYLKNKAFSRRRTA